MGYITSKNLGSKTNGQRSLTFFNITRGPKGGLIYMNDAPASVFGQINVDNEEVVYMQNDMSLSNDSFKATISNQGIVLKDYDFTVQVAPLIRRKTDFKVTDIKTQLGQEHLDASQLAGLTNSNPIYFLTNTPEHGKIMRIVRSSNPGEKPTRDREVWQFTHEEVKNGVIYFVRKDIMRTTMQANDSFTFRLEAPGVQPAYGLFSFLIGPSIEGTKSISNPITEDVTGVANTDAPVRSDLVIGLSIIFILILVLLVVVLIIRFRRARDASRSKCTAPNNTKMVSEEEGKYFEFPHCEFYTNILIFFHRMEILP